MQLKSLLWAFAAATTVFASAVPEDAEKRYYGAPSTITKWATRYKTKTTTCTKWSKTRTITKTKTTTRWSKTSTKWATKWATKTITKPVTKTVTKTITKPVSTKTVTKVVSTTKVSTVTNVSTVTQVETSCSSEPTSPPSGPRFAGCYKENPANYPKHMLSQQPLTSEDMTPTLCKQNCFTNGYPLAGLINGTSCACGEIFEESWAATLDDEGCSTPCSGDDSLPCGGDEAFEIYVNAISPKDLGCYDDNSSASILTEAYYTNPKMTIELCQTTCFGQDFTFAALRDGNRCYCNDGFINPPATLATDADCKTPCAGDDSGFQTCGGAGYLHVWALTN
ncbi:hypothetical protein TWF281_007987 [Arthrobotrys megalospora]